MKRADDLLTPGERNLAAFHEWANRQSDSDFRAIARTGKLNRNEITKATRFARSVLVQNPHVKAALQALETDLRQRGVLSPLAAHEGGNDGVDEPEPLRLKGQLAAAGTSTRLKALEGQVDVLRAENSQLKQRLKKFEALESILGRVGRLPR
jgi:hypothetical protein